MATKVQLLAETIISPENSQESSVPCMPPNKYPFSSIART